MLQQVPREISPQCCHKGLQRDHTSRWVLAPPTETETQFSQEAASSGLNTFFFFILPQSSRMVESVVLLLFFPLNGVELLHWGPDQQKANEQIGPLKARN